MKIKDKIFGLILIISLMLMLLPCEVYAQSDTIMPGNTTGITFYKGCSDNSKASIAAILKVCGLTSAPESSKSASQICTDSSINPYDVLWDYGDAWNEYVRMCDWSLVFDADYYMQQFPMLALQYHYDKDLMLMHFQTVGVHEGRQGCASFNVTAYHYNCSNEVYDAFHDNLEGYYLYYMLHYDTEKNVNTVTVDNGKPLPNQICSILTYTQKLELERINAYREESGSDPVEYNAELSAIACYRGYINVTEHIGGHDWLDINGNDLKQCDWISTAMNGKSAGSFSENNYEVQGGISRMARPIFANAYAVCESHNEAMRRSAQKWVGIGNMVWDGNSASWAEQFDLYAR